MLNVAADGDVVRAGILPGAFKRFEREIVETALKHACGRIGKEGLLRAVNRGQNPVDDGGLVAEVGDVGHGRNILRDDFAGEIFAHRNGLLLRRVDGDAAGGDELAEARAVARRQLSGFGKILAYVNRLRNVKRKLDFAYRRTRQRPAILYERIQRRSNFREQRRICRIQLQ